MTLQLAYNTTDSAALVDEAGFTIGGRGWGVIDSTDPRAEEGLQSGDLIAVQEDSARGSDNEDVVRAVADLDRRRKLVADAKALSKKELVEALPDEVVESLPVGGDGLPAKDDLVDAASASDEAITTPKPASRRGQK